MGYMNCEEDECESTASRRRLCEKHYRAKLSSGELLRLDVTQRWSKFVTPGKPDACWEWGGWRSEDGYGRFTINGKQTTSNRAALIMSGVEVPVGFDACHTCDNPPCVNPNHLYVGTRSQNLLDMSRRGRHPKQNLGERDWSAKFSDAEVDKWFEKHENGISFKQIARESGAHPSTVSRTIRGIQRRRKIQ